jgi:iron uptake system EfeUOB component EfeO/EfeM
LLDEVATGKVTGEEEYWSRTDLWDFQANIEGALVGFEGLRPVLQHRDPELDQQMAREIRCSAGTAGRSARGCWVQELRRVDSG